MASAAAAVSKEDGERERILTKSAKGAQFLIVLQIASRGLTFAANQILLRFISPELLGIATQLEVYIISVLYFARESLRLAIQRQRDSPEEPEVIGKSKSRDAREEPRQQLITAEKSQAVVNLAHVSLMLGVGFAGGLGWFYSRSQSSNPSVVNIPYFKESLALYAFAAVLELASEPCFVVIQQKSEYKIRAAAESLGTLLRCLITCGLMIVASMRGLEVGVLPFAIGQWVYGISICLVYYCRVVPISREAGFSLMLKPISSSSSSGYAMSYWPLPLLKLAKSLFAQGILKHFLSQGDVIMISSMASNHAQGMYALVSNYGGLVARMVFQPIEESSRNYFGKLLSSVDAKPSPSSIQAASRDLHRLLHIYALLSICAVVVGPPAAPILLRFVVGSRWSENGAGNLLAKYCLYIPLLAFNGVLESFVSVVATESQLNRQSAWMVVFSLAFAGTGYLFLHQLDFGAEGLVYANMANMAVRITWCSTFIKHYLREHSSTFSVRAILPTPSTMALAVGTFSVFHQAAKQYSSGGLEEAALLGSIAGCFLIIL